jgi:hypothetical protein
MRNRATKSISANHFPGSNPLSLFFIEQRNLNKEEVNLLRSHWEMFRKNFPVTGILYSCGRPSIFCAKAADFMNENDFKFLYENIHQSFLYFADKHSLTVFQTGQCVLTLCFGFRDLESLEAAKRFVEHNGHDMHLFKRTFVETWLIDLNNLEITPITSVFRKAGKTIMETAIETADELLKQNKDSHFSRVNFSSDALTKPSFFIQHARSFDAEFREGKFMVPDEWTDRFRPECTYLKILSCKNQIQKIESRKEEHERKTGEAVLSKYKAGFSFDDLDTAIEIVLNKQKNLDSIDEDIYLVKKMRFEWEESRKRVRELQRALKKLDQEYKNSCYRLTKVLFEQEIETVKTDPELKRIFADVLYTQSEIDKRNREISELKSEKTKFADRVKKETKIMYLKGINQVEDWNKDKNWAEIGEQIVNISSPAAFLSSSEPIFKTIEKVKIERKILNAKYAQEINIQRGIKNQIKGISDSKIKGMPDSIEYSYPWLELEEELVEKAKISKQELLVLFLSLGKSFRKILQKYPGSDLQTLDEEIKACESQILELKNEIDGLEAELRKLTCA